MYSYDSSVLNLSGGYIERIYSRGVSQVNISGNSSLGGCYFYDSTSVTCSSDTATVYEIFLYGSSTLNLSDGSICRWPVLEDSDRWKRTIIVRTTMMLDAGTLTKANRQSEAESATTCSRSHLIQDEDDSQQRRRWLLVLLLLQVVEWCRCLWQREARQRHDKRCSCTRGLLRELGILSNASAFFTRL